MKLVMESSLEHFALVKVVVSLWNLKDVRSLIANFSFRLPSWSRFEEWQKVEFRVMEKVPQLLLPGRLNEKIKGCIKPIGLQILKWIEHHCDDRYLHIYLPAEFCWKSPGVLDEKNTAGMLIKDERLDITNRYKLACIYCLENDIPQLWSQMPAKLRESFSYTGFNQGKIIIYWEKSMLERKSSLYYHSNSSIQSIFECSAICGNKVATEYFLKKLTTMEREESLVKTAESVDDADVLYLLLSQLDKEQQIPVFKNRPFKVLYCFLNWPFQSLFIEVANRTWDFLSSCDYIRLLMEIIDKIKLGYRDWNYQNLFRKFWQESPSDFKSYVTDRCTRGCLLPELIQIKDKENFMLIIHDAPFPVKKKIIFCDVMQNICEHLFLLEDWNLLGFLIQECLITEYEMKKFKNKFETRHNIRYIFAKKEQKWNQLFSFSKEYVSLNIKG